MLPVWAVVLLALISPVLSVLAVVYTAGKIEGQGAERMQANDTQIAAVRIDVADVRRRIERIENVLITGRLQ